MKYKNITILLVDDDQYHASIFTKNLYKNGITSEVKHFSNSFALEKYLFDKNNKHKDYNYLMLLDVKIPGLDIKKFTTKIRNDYLLNNLTIIALSESTKLLETELQRPYKAFLSKPLVQKTFEETLSKLNIFTYDCKNSCTKKLVMSIS